MKKVCFVIVLAFSFSVFSCKEDDARSCVMCSSPETMSFEVCQEGDGNAWVNGENTGTDYDTYISDLMELGVECGN